MRFYRGILLLFCISSTPLLAQLSTSFSQTGETVTTAGTPFQAERVTHTSRILSDGNQIVLEEHETIARDSEGRFYDESKQISSGGLPPKKSSIFYLLVDPVAHTSSNWSTLSANGNMQHTSPTTHIAVTAIPLSRDFATRHLAGDDIKITTEDLGKKVIANLPCTGVRTTTVIAVGRIGNTRPITLTSEQWTSTDLQITILEKDDDPLNGTRTSEFTSVTRGDPPASLFKIPETITFKNPFAGGVNLGTMR